MKDESETFTRAEVDAYNKAPRPCPQCGSKLHGNFDPVTVAEDPVETYLLVSTSCTNPDCLGG